MARLHVLPVPPQRALAWSVGRWGGVLGVVALIVALLVTPRVALLTLWHIAVPLLPASFFINPALWRGVCPLSTVNAWGNHLGTPRELPERTAWRLGVAGLVLFHLLVPARHLAFNTDGTALAGVIVALALVALAAGAGFSSRSAFCNALCPVLPIERLYGQAPIVDVNRGRCASCTVCTPRACIDLADRKAMRQLLGPSRRHTDWLHTPFGIFAGSLPGFIVAYSVLPDGAPGQWATVYATTLGASLASYWSVRVLIDALAIPPLRATLALGAVSGVLYYWVSAPLISAALGLPGLAVSVIRGASSLLIALWVLRAVREDLRAAITASA